MERSKKKIVMTSRRRFLQNSLLSASVPLLTIVPRHVLGGPNYTPPSETFGACLIGVGGRGPGTFNELSRLHKLSIKEIAKCDVKWKGKIDNKTRYTDYRKVLERKDIDIVAIATPPHWHALISIHAMESGKDVLCEKPMTRFISEGRAVVEAVKRTGQVYQIGTYGRFRQQTNAGSREMRKIIKAGLNKGYEVRLSKKGGFKTKQWSGPLNIKPMDPPKWLDWDLYCGPSPLRPYHYTRHGGMHRGYWDYDGGGLGDMGQHYLDPLTYRMGKDHTHPVKVEASAPPAHPDVAGTWGWVKFTYADGVELVLESHEWGKPLGLPDKNIQRSQLTEEQQKKFDSIPDEKPMIGFGEAVKTRQQPGGNAVAAHYTSSLMHLANVAIRTGRTIQFDPEKEIAIGDEEANRIIDQPMRAPWYL